MTDGSTGGGAPLIVVVGPTGTGKSDLSLALAERLTGTTGDVEIVNADSMQLYRGMDIGTAKLRPEERRGVPHHLLDVLDVTEEATVARYQPTARQAIRNILDRGKTPVLVGGSGLYVSSVIYEFDFPGTDPVIRQRLEDELAAVGPGMLHRRLTVIDPTTAERVGPHNGRRIVRALEVAEMTGDAPSAALPDEPTPWHPSVILGLRAPREQLVERLDRRVDRMWADGLVAEADALRQAGIERGVTASRAIGYAQALAQLSGELSADEARAQTAALTRRYARRQVSWFKRYPHAHWLDYDDPRLVDHALRLIAEHQAP
ncbi:tRNA (adenosine(37)-N6)-dimethylallyltransferase MiaA [Okibacterium fritillariae]|uniref:tRNA (adenosine(37)-N6)-dimethylallyltransferase MiaA n=1 Tax=Okibacterium fritillariae TaxID=123320 RepID=UPI0040556E58